MALYLAYIAFNDKMLFLKASKKGKKLEADFLSPWNKLLPLKHKAIIYRRILRVEHYITLLTYEKL